MAKTNWQYGEIVTEEDFNQLGQEMNEATAGLAVLEEQIGEAEQISKAYTDQQIQLVTATGIPKLVTYSYVLTAGQQDQTDFEIPLETFVKETDTVTVAQNSTVLSTERYSIIDPKTVRLAEGVNIGTEIFIQVWKNVPIGPDGAISAAVLANDTVTESKMADEMKKDIPGGVAGYDTFATHLAENAKHVPHLGTTTNVGNAYSVTSSEIIDGNDKFSVKFNAVATGTATLKISSDGTARTLKKPDGSDFKPKAGIYSFIRDGVNFQLLGEGGEYGNAQPQHVLSPYTIGTDEGVVPGTIPSKGAQTFTPGTTNQTIASGQYLSGVQTIAGSDNLKPENIKAGVNIFDKVGTLQPASGSNVYKSFSFGNNPSRVSGTQYSEYFTIDGLSFTPRQIVGYGTAIGTGNDVTGILAYGEYLTTQVSTAYGYNVLKFNDVQFSYGKVVFRLSFYKMQGDNGVGFGAISLIVA